MYADPAENIVIDRNSSVHDLYLAYDFFKTAQALKIYGHRTLRAYNANIISAYLLTRFLFDDIPPSKNNGFKGKLCWEVANFNSVKHINFGFIKDLDNLNYNLKEDCKESRNANILRNIYDKSMDWFNLPENIPSPNLADDNYEAKMEITNFSLILPDDESKIYNVDQNGEKFFTFQTYFVIPFYFVTSYHSTTLLTQGDLVVLNHDRKNEENPFRNERKLTRVVSFKSEEEKQYMKSVASTYCSTYYM